MEVVGADVSCEVADSVNVPLSVEVVGADVSCEVADSQSLFPLVWK